MCLLFLGHEFIKSSSSFQKQNKENTTPHEKEIEIMSGRTHKRIKSGKKKGKLKSIIKIMKCLWANSHDLQGKHTG